MNDKKITFYIIVILLIITTPLAILGTTLHIKNKPKEKVAETQEFFYNGKLHFYTEGKLIGTYTCENPEGYCDYAISKNQKEYMLEEYIPEKREKINIIKNKYSFLIDAKTEELQEAEIILFDIVNNKEIGKFKEVKNYGIGIENDIYIVKNIQNLWGVIQFDDTADVKMPFEYDYIALSNQISSSNKIYANTFATLKDNKWQLVDCENNKKTIPLEQNIISYNEEYIILETNGSKIIIDYTGKISLEGSYKNLQFYEKYLGITNHSNEFYLYDLESKKIISNSHKINNDSYVNIKITSNKIEIEIAGTNVENIAIY